MAESCVRGFHVYKDVWAPVTGEVLLCEMEGKNLFDPYAVAIKEGSEVIVHVPRKISAACFLFLEALFVRPSCFTYFHIAIFKTHFHTFAIMAIF